MRRILAATTALPMKNIAVAGTSTSATTAAAAAASAQLRSHTHSHSHSHGGGGHHHHSHAAIEKEIEGANLRSCQMATLAGGATNIFFCVTKLWVGSSGGSVALVADGFHALTDIVADVVSYASISLSKKKFPRCRFPFGIGRLETSGAVFVAAILLVGGVMLLVQSFQSCLSDLGEVVFPSAAAAATVAAAAAAGAVASHSEDGAAAEEHHHPHTGHGAHEEEAHGHSHAAASSHGHSHAGGAAHGHSHFEVTQYDATTGKQVILWTMVTLAASSVVCKELLFHWTRRVGQRAGSRVVVANAYHHRADAWSGAVALVGVAGQMMGIPGVDGIAGLVVSLSICKIGYGLFRDSVLEFFDYQNAEEVSQVRERLQDFHLRVLGDGAVTAERNTPMAAAASPDVHESKIRYVNVFLMRHGHSYALHVKLLVHESQTAAQIQDAVAELEKLAKASLPVQETFIALMVCSPTTVTRSEYFQTLYKDTFGASPAPSEADEGEGSDDEHHDHHHTAPQRKRDGPADAETAKEMFIAAEGNLVNPSLEKVLRALSEFHGFTKPIRYRWETRTVVTPKDSSCECSRDVESVAKIFGCQLREAEGDDREECQHGHNHSHGHEHPPEEAEAEEGKKTQ